jgi:co-chaperonin GroES (HSP10)
MNFTPLGNRLLTERVDLEQISAGGLILGTLDEDMQNDTCFAKVIEVGNGKYYPDTGWIAPTSKPGDIVVYKVNAGLKFKHGQYLYELIDESNVLMIVSGSDVIPVAVGTYEKSKSDILGKGVQFLG